MSPSAIEKLVSIAAGPLGPPVTVADGANALLEQMNGFYAFESALHVFPIKGSAQHRSVEDWNADSLWRDAYGELATGCWFFAEDVFGSQFCLADGAVHVFDPETGERERLGDSLEEWANAVLADYAFLTGHPLAHAWQEKNGPLPVGTRLVPKVPFTVGGEFRLDNLAAMDAVAGMRFRGEFARQIKDLPEGAEIELVVKD